MILDVVPVRPRVEMTAVLVTSTNQQQVAEWAGTGAFVQQIGCGRVAVLREDGDSYDFADPGDWVVRGPAGAVVVAADAFYRDFEVLRP